MFLFLVFFIFQTKYSSLQNQFQRTEMELIDARMLATTIDSDVEDDGDGNTHSINRQLKTL